MKKALWTLPFLLILSYLFSSQGTSLVTTPAQVTGRKPASLGKIDFPKSQELYEREDSSLSNVEEQRPTEAILEGEDERLDQLLSEVTVDENEVNREVEVAIAEGTITLQDKESYRKGVRQNLLQDQRWEVVSQFNGYDVKEELESFQGL